MPMILACMPCVACHMQCDLCKVPVTRPSWQHLCVHQGNQLVRHSRAVIIVTIKQQSACPAATTQLSVLLATMTQWMVTSTLWPNAPVESFHETATTAAGMCAPALNKSAQEALMLGYMPQSLPCWRRADHAKQQVSDTNTLLHAAHHVMKLTIM